MSKLTRVLQKVFGSTGTTDDFEQFGSFAAGSVDYTKDPLAIQGLANWLTGWASAVVGDNAPVLEDLNAFCLVVTYQLAYLMQQGVAEYDATTTYYTGSIVNSGGTLYQSLTDNNTGNATTDITNWTNLAKSIVLSYVSDGQWTCPAGLKAVRVQTKRKIRSFAQTVDALFYLDTDGNAYGIGLNIGGVIGANISPVVAPVVSTPTLVSGGIKFQQLFGRQQNANMYGIDASGNAYAWGQNAYGQIGDGTVIPKSSPVLVSGGLKFKLLKNGVQSNNTWGLTRDGKVYAWGDNSGGFLGVGDVTPRSTPTILAGGLKNIKRLETSGGDGLGMALDGTGKVYTWGLNSGGACGNNTPFATTAAFSSPVLVVGGHTFVDITLGSGYDVAFGIAVPMCYAIDNTGAAYAWGDNTWGQIGNGTSGNSYSSPVLISGGLTFKKIYALPSGGDAIYGGAFGITTDGTLYSWGNNSSGQLGLGDTVSRSTPTIVLGGIKFTELTVNDGIVLGLDGDGNCYGWGYNGFGRLGTGDLNPRSSPVVIASGVRFVAINANLNGDPNVQALDTKGNVYVWGINGSFQLGDGTIVNKSSPILITQSFKMPMPYQITDAIVSTSPGKVYDISVGGYFSTVGNEVISQLADSLTLNYDQ